MIRDDSTSDELWLSSDDAAQLGEFLLRAAYTDPKSGGGDEPKSFVVIGAGDALHVRIYARDPRFGAITVPRKHSTPLSRFVTRAAEAVSMIERLDAMNETPE